MLGGYAAPATGAQMIRFVFDQRALAQCFLARILWLQGSADQALGLTQEIVEAAVARGDGLSLCQTLVQGACPVALFVGDLEALERYSSMLLDYSQRQGLDFWQAFGRCFQNVLFIKRGEVADGLGKLADALSGLREIQFGVHYGVFLGEFADALARVGRAAEGRRTIDEALARAERNEERWYEPELLRIKGEIVLRAAHPNASEEAERCFLESIDLSRRQETIAWRLRAATSLARLRVQNKRIAEARDMLAPLYAEFGEGLNTADVRAAKELLEQFVTKGGKASRSAPR
jgi:predicted ATPase